MARKPTRREHALLVVAVVSAIGLGYVSLRYTPAARAYQNVLDRIETTQQKLKKTKVPVIDDLPPVESLQARLGELQQQTEAAETQTRQWNDRLVPADDPGSVQQLMLEISALARQTGVRIQENTPMAKTAIEESPDKVLREMGSKQQRGRPIQRIGLLSSYAGLRAFIEGLVALPWHVAIVRLEIETVPVAGIQRGPQPLEASLVIAL